ncbi:hypothetical protein AA3250_2128 [Gluconobacter albidus NBRC 3250]|nr:hypothetical protein AA3250_2128 [Gluconobacter albidus NBRC 3250]
MAIRSGLLEGARAIRRACCGAKVPQPVTDQIASATAVVMVVCRLNPIAA